MAKLNPRYELPGQKYFVEHQFPHLYNEVKENIVIPKLAQASHFAVTTDLWTSNSNSPFMSFTVHFIDFNWHLQSLCLDTVAIFQDHTGKNIAEAFQDVLGNWGRSISSVVATTTDNGSNFVAEFAMLLCEWLSCFGHNPNLAVMKAVNIDRVQQVVKKCHSLIEVFSRSWKKSRDLRQKQDDLALPKHKLIADVSTRWRSTYQMVARIVEQHQAICAVLAEDRKYWNKMPGENEFANLEGSGAFIKIYRYVIGEKHVTISAVRPLLDHILKTIVDVKPSDRPIVKQMKEKKIGRISQIVTADSQKHY